MSMGNWDDYMDDAMDKTFSLGQEIGGLESALRSLGIEPPAEVPAPEAKPDPNDYMNSSYGLELDALNRREARRALLQKLLADAQDDK